MIVPANVPLIEAETGTVLPTGNGPASVICNVKVCVENVKFVLGFTPDMAIVPRAGLKFVVMLVEACGV